MISDVIPIRAFWSVLRNIPGVLLKHYFPKERLAQLIHIDVQPRHDSVLVDLGECASFRLALQIFNQCPVLVEFDRASLCFWCGGTTFNISAIERQQIAPGDIGILWLTGTIPDGQANLIARHIESNPVALSGTVDFNCKIHPFQKRLGHLDGINAKFYNVHIRSNT